MSLFKLNLWLGRSAWGMMLRDEQCLIDYLETRPEVDKRRIAATGMSMGCTRSWWLAAIDDRVQAGLGGGRLDRAVALFHELYAGRCGHDHAERLDNTRD